jgi:glucose-1-phosphate thymidylyltransferase
MFSGPMLNVSSTALKVGPQLTVPIFSALMKGVILAGGTGSRLHPLTRITNKHLLPVYDKPMIFHPIETLVSAGIDEVMVVTGGNHAGEFLPLLGNGVEFGLRRLQFSYQARAGGIAEALGLCESFIDGDRVVVMLGDNIVGQTIAPYVDNFRRQDSGARLLLKEMSELEHLRHLGVPIFGKDDRLRFIREKPQTPPSPYAVIGIYMYDPSVFEIVRNLEPSGRGELEITDVNNAYIDRGVMEYDVIDGFWGDAGESIEVYYSVVDQVRRYGTNKPVQQLTKVAV